MDAYTAVKNDEMVVLNYNHSKREISIEDGGPISIEDAMTLFDRALVADCNAAMTTLLLHDYDMEAVEKLHRGCECEQEDACGDRFMDTLAALEIVYELAEQNVIPEAEDRDQHKRQSLALDVVHDFVVNNTDELEIHRSKQTTRE